MIHYYKTHLLLVAKVNARVCIKFCKTAFTFANDDRLFIVRGRVYFPAHYFAKCRFSEIQERTKPSVNYGAAGAHFLRVL